MKLKVFSNCSSELEPALKRFINLALNIKDENQELYVVDESSENSELRKFWEEIKGASPVPTILFITYSDADRPGCLEFLKPLINKWDTWNPTTGVSLRQVLEYLLGIRD